jgi:hypothetical protein
VILATRHASPAADNRDLAAGDGRQRARARRTRLYERIGGRRPLLKLGPSLNNTVGAYSRVGSLETRVLVTARKLEEHGIGGELEMPSLVDGTARPLTAPELVERKPLAILAGDADAA